MKNLNIINSVTRTYSRSTPKSDLLDKLKSAGLTNYKINSFVSTMKNSVKQSKEEATAAASNDNFRSATVMSYNLNSFVTTMKNCVKQSNEEITATAYDEIEIKYDICIPIPLQSDILGRNGCWGVWSSIWSVSYTHLTLPTILLV